MTGASDLLVLVGNGLPIAVNSSLRLDALTQSFLERHAEDRADIERLSSGLDLGDVDPATDFEGVVAGLEAAEETVAAFMGLASRSSHPDLQEAAELLEERGVPGLVRRLYYAYCAEILDAIAQGARMATTEPVRVFGEWMRDLYRLHNSMGLFTLNYDILLERMLVDEDFLGLKEEMVDFFSGRPELVQQIVLAPEAPALPGRLFLPDDALSRPIQLHHLHGCLTHFLRTSDGAVFKFNASSVRDAGIYQHLRDAEASDFQPSVILGSRKVIKSTEWPFSFAFHELAERARRARTVVIAGYSFRDGAVNSRLRAAALAGRQRWIVIDLKPGADGRAFKKEINDLLPGADIEWALDGFAGALPRLSR